QLVDGVTKLTGITFQSRDESQAENYRKMMVAMATDVRVILIKLADRLHNMRTLGALPKQKQLEKARETLEIYAPLAHRLGIHAIKWELEDLSFQRLHPRKYDEIKKLVAQQRVERERYVDEAGDFLRGELGKVGVEADISGRAKHLYSIYSKKTKKGRELKVDLFEDEVFVFTPKGEVKNLSAGSTPLDFAYAVHTDVGHRCVGAKVNGKIVPLHYQLRSGAIVEILTAKRERGPSRDWLAL